MGSTTGFDGIEERISLLRKRDRRFGRNAYYFVLDALDYTMERCRRHPCGNESRHVGGRELLEGLRELAADQFGPLATICLERWGIHCTEDVGEVVFNLIEVGLLSRRPEDSRLDFAGGYDFRHTFE